MIEHKADVAIVGAGILGLAHAWHAARAGKRVVVFDRSPKASGASVRNFGMIWPIGQPHGEMHAMAMRSREHWLEVLAAAKLPFFPTGSLHALYRNDELAVAEEFVEKGASLGFDCTLLNPDEALLGTCALHREGLQGALWSPTEIVVDPRVTLATLPAYLAEQFQVEFHFSTLVRSIELPAVETGAGWWKVERAIVCSGDDFETLFPEHLAASGITRVKIQMLRTPPQPGGWQLGPSLAAGLTMQFYRAFEECLTLTALKNRVAAETPEYNTWGIHGLVSQTAGGELTLGDSHEYGTTVDIFNKEIIDELIMRYIRGFLNAPDLSIAQRWHGVYSKHPQKPYVSLSPDPGVRVVTAPGGSGMTLSFGLAEKTAREMELI
jgi:FAD dependent oxidoreductase TIGR03364